MKVSLGSNIASLNIQRNLADNTALLSRTYERLSTGLRINKASDDAAGLAIASTLDADSRIYTQGIRNVNDGISILEIADSALQSLQSILTRQKELAEQAANGVYSLVQRRALHLEATALVNEYNRIVESTTFNGRYLFRTPEEDFSVQAAYSRVAFAMGTESSRNVGDGTFRTESEIATISGNGGMDMADFNNDGKIDLVSITGGNQLGVQIGGGDGTFGLSGFITYSGNFGDRSILARDVNGDGRQDILTFDGAGSTFSVLLGTGTGSFGSAVSYSLGVAGQEASTGDFDNDGDVDVAVLTGSGIAISTNNGSGVFSAPRFFGSSGGTAIDVGDFNADGNLDLIRNNSGTLTLFSGDGRGNFSSNAAGTGAGAGNIAVADFNRDGYLDLVGTDVANQMTVFINQGNNTFTLNGTYTTPSTPYAPEVGDLDGDGLTDIVVASYNDGAGSEMVYFLGRGDGTFASAQTITTSGGYREIRIGDFNNDGALDIAGADRAALNMSILISNPRQTMRQAFFSLLSAGEARSALTQIEAQQNLIRSEIGVIGSYQSRFMIAVENLQSSNINFRAAESRIKDADIAEESSTLIRAQILQQAASATLAQANQQPALALKLLST